MSSAAGMLDLGAGARLVIDGAAWSVESFEPQFGRVLLCGEDGARMRSSVRTLLNDPGCRPAAPPSAGGSGVQAATLHDLTASQQQWTRLRFAHVQEAETGYRSGDPLWALPGEPRPDYDPARTTVR